MKQTRVTDGILHFPKIPPGIDWLRKAGEEWAEFSEREHGKRNDNLVAVYRYIKWSGIWRLSDRMSDERTVAYGMLLKYYHLIHQTEPPPADVVMITKAEKMLAESNAAIRAKKASKL